MKSKIKSNDSDLGILPKDWNVIEFSDLLENGIRHGLYKSKEFFGSGVKMLKMGTQYSSERISDQDMELVQLNKDEIDRFKINPSDLIFSRTSMMTDGAGKCSYVMEHDDSIVFDGNLLCTTLKSKIADSKYYYYYFNSKMGKDEISKITQGTQSRNIAASNLLKIHVPYPSLSEQKTISAILWNIDNRIELNKKMNNTLRDIIKTIFKHWFIDFEFPDDKGKPYKSSGGKMVFSEDLGKKIPSDWGVDLLGNHSVIKGRIGWKGLQVSEYVDDGPRIVGGSQLVDGRVDWNDCPQVPQKRYDESPDIMLRQGDILMTKDGTIGKLAYVDELIYSATVASGIFVIRNSSSILNQMYLWNYFQSNLFRWLVETRIEGSVVPHLYQKDITNLNLVLPSSPITSRFELIANNIQNKITANSNLSSTLLQTRALFISELISGKTRLSKKVKK